MQNEIKTIKLAKKMYVKEAILKASYIFSNDCFFYIDEDDENYLIKAERKKII